MVMTTTGVNASCSLNSFKGVIMEGAIKGDTGSVDYSLCGFYKP